MGVDNGRLAWRISGFLCIAAMTGACSAKDREFVSGIDASTRLPGTGGAPSDGPVAIDRQDGGVRPGEPSLAAASEGEVSGGSGLCDNLGECSCDPDVESCAPVSLCADGGPTCESTCPGCLIDQECLAADTVNANNTCLVCDPARDALAWSSNDGASCDDNLFCTTDDACTDGLCTGTDRLCEDGIACNGVSECDEDSDACSPDNNQCNENALCNVVTDTCVNECSGCSINGVCLNSGAEQAGNPCMVCDPNRSSASYSAAVGKACGAGSSACSQQDTCDALGVCQPNDLPANAACGDSSSSTCDRSDTCDGNGACQRGLVSNGTPCDDNAFCTVGDQCQGGTCVGTGNRNCGSSQNCNEGSDQCQCQGCVIANSCFARGALNNSNPCQVCDPTRSTTAFSLNLANGNCCEGCLPGQICQGGACIDPRVGTGARCVADADCLSGNCNDFNVCCESACSGTCQGCGADGRCDDAPVNDNRCTVTCPENSTCRVSKAPAAGACASFGQCAQCEAANTRAGILCDPGRICDGAGGCSPDVSGLVAAGPLHTCAVTNTGALRCWGLNGVSGMLGYGHTQDIGDDETPLQAAARGLGGDLDFGNGRRVVQVTAGTSNSCALFDNGTVRCWALQDPDSAGTEDITIGPDGIVLPGGVGDVELGGQRALQISTGSGHTCAVLADGRLRCWGRPLTSESLTFGGLSINQVSVAGVGACAVLQGGILRCWGSDNPGPNQNINTGGEVVAVSVGTRKACAVLAGGALRCWGTNQDGQLGLGHTRDIAFNAPLADSLVNVGGQVRQVTMGFNGQACATLQNGTLRCWGSSGSAGNLGYRHTQNIGDIQTPVQAAQPGGLGGALDFGPGRSVLASHGARCALRDDRQLFCWGANFFGEQGNPTFFPNGTGARAPADVGPVQFQ